MLDGNIANLSVESGGELAGFEFKSLTRPGGGLRIEVDLARNLSLALSPAYVGRGAKFSVPGDVEDVTGGSARYDYFDLPVELKLSFGAGRTKPYVVAGPTLGLLARARGKVDFDDGTSEETDVKDTTKSTSLGLGVGAGLDLALGGQTRGFVEAQYMLGLTDINDDPDITESMKHKGFELRAGVTFSLVR
jgi:opacity protein-like surface antigen